MNNTLLINAKSLRTYQTDAELRLWYHLRAHRFLGYKFKRQKPIAQYIVDFVCIEQKLIIEIDGGQHAEQLEYDQARDTELRRLGYQVLRFWNNDVLKNTEGVLEKIREFIELTTPSPPAPLPQAGEGSSQLPSILTKQSIPTASFPSPIHGRGARGEGTLYLGIDFGTSGARASAIDAQKNMLWEQRVAYPDAAAQTALDWRNALHTLLSDLPKDIAVSLRGIAIDGTSGTVLLCDAHLEPVSPALLYNDNRAHEQATQLKAIAPYSIAPSVQSVCTSTSGLAKFLWLTQRYPNAHYFLHQADWLTALLSGKLGISDYHNALKTGYDVAALCWPDWILALPHAHLLPKVVAPGFIIGTIQADVAAHFGIAADCAIHAGTTDSIAAFMASDVHEARVGVTSLGTTLVIKQLSGQRIDAPEFGIYSHRYGDLWLVGGASNAGAGVLKHYFDDTQLAALSARIDPRIDSPLDYYPLPKVGERFPISDANLLPRLTPRPADDAEFLHGLLQGLARIEAAGYAKLERLGAPPLKRVVSNGGGAKNAVWRQMRARLLGVPVEASKYSAAAYGAALLALTSMEKAHSCNI